MQKKIYKNMLLFKKYVPINLDYQENKILHFKKI